MVPKKKKNALNPCIWIVDPLQDSILTAHQPLATIFATIALLSTKIKISDYSINEKE